MCADIDEAAAKQSAQEIIAKYGEGIGLAGTGISNCGPAIGLPCDITDRSSIARMLENTLLAYGGLDSVVVTAGFHGDEKAGPLTLLAHAADLFAYARARGVGLRLYPCINPSGFVLGTRYNASGEHPNNDLLRYRVGRAWKGELSAGDVPTRWRAFRKRSCAPSSSATGMNRSSSKGMTPRRCTRSWRGRWTG